mgnify:CR=1 FL=1
MEYLFNISIVNLMDNSIINYVFYQKNENHELTYQLKELKLNYFKILHVLESSIFYTYYNINSTARARARCSYLNLHVPATCRY